MAVKVAVVIKKSDKSGKKLMAVFNRYINGFSRNKKK